MSKRIIGLTAGMAVLLTLALGIAAVVHGCGPADRPVPFTNLRDLAHKSSLQFPAGSRLVDGYLVGAYGWGNIFGYARVELPPERVTEFFNQPAFSGRVAYRNQPPVDLYDINVARNAHDPALLQRWGLMKIRKSASAQGGELNSEQHMPVAAYVNLDDPAHPMLYLHWFN